MRSFFSVTTLSVYRESELKSEHRRLKPPGMKKDARLSHQWIKEVEKFKRHWNQQKIKGACCLFVFQNLHWYKEIKQKDSKFITLVNPISDGGLCRRVWWGGERWWEAHSASGAKNVFLDSSICSTAVLSPLKDANRQLLGHWRQHFLPGKWSNTKEYWC